MPEPGKSSPTPNQDPFHNNPQDRITQCECCGDELKGTDFALCKDCAKEECDLIGECKKNKKH